MSSFLHSLLARLVKDTRGVCWIDSSDWEEHASSALNCVLLSKTARVRTIVMTARSCRKRIYRYIWDGYCSQ